MIRKENETYFEYITRATDALKDKKIDNIEWCACLLEEEKYGGEVARKASYVVEPMLEKLKKDFATGVDNEDMSISLVEQLETLKSEIIKERKKKEDATREHNRFLTSISRDEYISELISEAIQRIEKFETPNILTERYNDFEENVGILAFGDAHFGAEFEIKGLYGEILSKYNEEEFKRRMWKLLEETKEIINKENLHTIKVYSLGDTIDGLLRVSQISKLKYGVVDQTIGYAQFIVSWLNELSKHCLVEYHSVFGNHSELRMINQPKGTFIDDNMEKVITAFIEELSKQNSRIEVVKNPTGLIFDNVCGFNILAIHGEVKSLINAIKDFSITYNTSIDYIIGGHKHHKISEEVGYNKEVITIPSIVGVDKYSVSLNKTSRAGAKFMIFNQEDGLKIEYNIKLN